MTDKPLILVVDDDAAITDALLPFLERAGFRAHSAPDGRDALRKIPNLKPDLIILDVMMPYINGRDVLRQLRAAENWTPVILLTQIGEAVERAMALEEGADDYLNKPFEPHELIARIRSILRRIERGNRSIASSTSLSAGPLTLNRTSRRVFLDGQELVLTPKAILVLEYLLLHPDELISRDRLLDAVWGWDHPIGSRAIDSRIAELRRSIPAERFENRFIETVPGQGYRLLVPVQGDRS